MDASTHIANLAATYSALIQDHLALFFGFWVLSFAAGAAVMRWILSDQIKATEALIVAGEARAREVERSADDRWLELEAKIAAHARQNESASREREAAARRREADAKAAEMEAREEVDKLRLIAIRLLAIAQKSQPEIERGKTEIETHAKRAGVAVSSLLELSQGGEASWAEGFVPIQIAWPLETSRQAAGGVNRTPATGAHAGDH